MSDNGQQIPVELPSPTPQTCERAVPAVHTLPGKLLGELPLPVPGGHEELLKHRFLCRKGGSMLFSTTGVGKSVWVVEAAICWSVGKPFVGIEPTRPLAIWLIEAEDTEEDVGLMREGVVWGLQNEGILSADECALARMRLRVIRHVETSGAGFGEWLRGELQNARNRGSGQVPDLIIVNPAFSYLGGDVSSQSDVSTFLRHIIFPILNDFDLGILIVHHCVKPSSGGSKRDRAVPDYVYAGAGSAEWSNWPRSTLVIEETSTRGICILRAGKCGNKLGWLHPTTGEPLYERHIAWGLNNRIYWREPDATVVAAAQACRSAGSSTKRRATPEDVAKLSDIPRGKAGFEHRVGTELGIGRDAVRNLTKVCLEQGMLQQVKIKAFPQQTLIGLPGVTAAEAARRSAEYDGAKGAAVLPPVTAAPAIPATAAVPAAAAVPVVRPTRPVL